MCWNTFGWAATITEEYSFALQRSIDSNDEEKAAQQKLNPILQLHKLSANSIDGVNLLIGTTIKSNNETMFNFLNFTYYNATSISYEST